MAIPLIAIGIGAGVAWLFARSKASGASTPDVGMSPGGGSGSGPSTHTWGLSVPYTGNDGKQHWTNDPDDPYEGGAATAVKHDADDTSGLPHDPSVTGTIVPTQTGESSNTSYTDPVTGGVWQSKALFDSYMADQQKKTADLLKGSIPIGGKAPGFDTPPPPAPPKPGTVFTPIGPEPSTFAGGHAPTYYNGITYVGPPKSTTTNVFVGPGPMPVVPQRTAPLTTSGALRNPTVAANIGTSASMNFRK